MAASLPWTEQKQIDWCMSLQLFQVVEVVDSSRQHDNIVDNALQCAWAFKSLRSLQN